jgi:hypothetical protein
MTSIDQPAEEHPEQDAADKEQDETDHGLQRPRQAPNIQASIEQADHNSESDEEVIHHLRSPSLSAPARERQTLALIFKRSIVCVRSVLTAWNV